jgi:hypothetical protein
MVPQKGAFAYLRGRRAASAGYRKTRRFLSAFPMFVPSLSWQKDRCYIKMVNKMYRFPHLRVDIAPVSGCSLTPLAGDRGEPRCSGRWAPGKRGVVATATQGCVSITPCRDKTRQDKQQHKTHKKRILGSQLSPNMCLSRACLGKLIVLRQLKMAPKMASKEGVLGFAHRL